MDQASPEPDTPIDGADHARGSDRAADAGGKGLERLVFFTDAIAAIALTLLGLELPLPQGDSDAAMWRSVRHLLTHDYFAFALSFVVIAAFWMSHHRFFDYVADFDNRLIRLNLVFLFFIVSLPYTTRLISIEGDYQVGPALYAANVALVALSLLGIGQYTIRAGFLKPGVTRRTAAEMPRAMILPAASFLVSIPLAFVNPTLAELSWLVLAAGGGFVERRILRRRRHA